MKEIKGFRNEYYFLSNFFLVPIFYNGKRYRNAEAAFQAQKTLNDDMQWAFTNLTPRDAKIKGKQIPLRIDWEQIKVRVMKEVLESKFSNPVLRKQLIETEDAFLEETNTWHDNFWGNCICDKCKDSPGKNILGKLLMELREKIKEQK